jgi:hypothetical protein
MDALVVSAGALLVGLVISWVVMRSATRANEIRDQLHKLVVRGDATIERLNAIGAMLDERLATREQQQAKDTDAG